MTGAPATWGNGPVSIAASISDDDAYCRSQVERFDRDRYILTLAANAAHRPALWALYAFNHEIAKTREIVREAPAGHIRLTWWRDALDAPEMPAHDVARALGRAIKTYDLPKELFHILLNTRTRDLDNMPFASLQDFIAYIDASNTPLLDLTAKITGDAKHPGDLGIAYGITGIIRALPFLAHNNRCVLPLPMLHDIGLMPEQFHHLKASPALQKSVRMLADIAQSHLNNAQTDNPVFKIQKRMTALYLKRIAKAQYNPFDPRVYAPVPFLGLRLLF